MHPLLVRTVPSTGGTEGNNICGDCSLIDGCSLAGSLLVGISGITSNSSVDVGDTISWRRFCLSISCDVWTVGLYKTLEQAQTQFYQYICDQVSTLCLLGLMKASCEPYVDCQMFLFVSYTLLFLSS